MNEGKIRELFDLCVRVSNETQAHVNFDYSAREDTSEVYLFVFDARGEIVRHFSVSQFYDFNEEDYKEVKECLLKILINGRCPLNLEEEDDES